MDDFGTCVYFVLEHIYKERYHKTLNDIFLMQEQQEAGRNDSESGAILKLPDFVIMCQSSLYILQQIFFREVFRSVMNINHNFFSSLELTRATEQQNISN